MAFCLAGVIPVFQNLKLETKMFTKLFNLNKLSSSSRQNKAPKDAAGGDPEEESAALRIIRPGGIVDCYYTPIRAVRILEKYPSFVLTRPDVFRQPWNPVIKRDQILTPGQKYFIVPKNTVRKLRRRIKKPSQVVRAGPSNLQTSKYIKKPCQDVRVGPSNLQTSKYIKKPSQDVPLGSSNLKPSKSKRVSANNRPLRQQQPNKDPRQGVGGAHDDPGQKNGFKSKKPSTFFRFDMKHKVYSGPSTKRMKSKEPQKLEEIKYQIPLKDKRSVSSLSWQPSLTSITEDE